MIDVVRMPTSQAGSTAGAAETPGRRTGGSRNDGAGPARPPLADPVVGDGGRRLAAAFDSVLKLPAQAESQRRLVAACQRRGGSSDEVATAIASDAALAMAVMRAANDGGEPRRAVGSIGAAVETLGQATIRDIALAVATYDPLDAPSSNAESHERFRRHAVATRHAADRIAELARIEARHGLAVAALFHDVGRIVLEELYGEFEALDAHAATPEERVRQERRELGVDHALVGAVLVRRWRLPSGIRAAIERHHSPKAEGHAAVIGLADLIVHYAGGDPVVPEAIVDAARRLSLEREHLTLLLYEFPHAGAANRPAPDPCPLSDREIDALRGLAQGKVYKQIASELSLSASTIRTHLHNVYRKLGAVDRAQAVLIARDRGWI
jgi:putative nucleotidyltransferase with HDIG domain